MGAAFLADVVLNADRLQEFEEGLDIYAVHILVVYLPQNLYYGVLVLLDVLLLAQSQQVDLTDLGLLSL